MSNELENKTAYEMTSDAEIVETKKEMMRYRANSFSYWLGFVAIGFSVFASFYITYEIDSVLGVL